MKKLFFNLFSYKTWSYAAAVVTVLMAFPVIKEYLKRPPKIAVLVGNYWVTDKQTITLLYVIPNSKIAKFQVPLPISFMNVGKNAAHNFLARFSTKMLEIYDETRRGYMKRFLCTDEYLNSGMQNIYVKSVTMISRGRIELSSNGYELNIVRRNEKLASSFSFDNFDFDLEITYDGQEKAQNIHFNVLCMFENQYKEMLLNRVSLENGGMTFAILTVAECLRKQEDNIKIMQCKLRETEASVVKM